MLVGHTVYVSDFMLRLNYISDVMHLKVNEMWTRALLSFTAGFSVPWN